MQGLENLIPAVLKALIVFASIVFLAALIKGRKVAYERIPCLLTPTEQRFYKALVQSVGSRAIVMSKVRIADLVKVKSQGGSKVFWRAFRPIAQKHVDFVLLHPVTLETLCAIELDDKSHGRRDRIERDRFVERVFAQSGIPLGRYFVRSHYDFTDLDQYLPANDIAYRRTGASGKADTFLPSARSPRPRV